MRFVREQKRSHLNALLAHDHTVNSAVLDGIDGRLVEVQARAVEVLPGPSPWNKAITVAGMPRSEAADLLTRIGSALARRGTPYSEVKIVLNFYPEGHGPGLDLPAALAVMQAAGLLPGFDAGDYLVFGSLDVHGEVRHTPAALPLAMAVRNGQGIVFPESNAQQVRIVKAVRKTVLYPVADLDSAVSLFMGEPIPELRGGQVRYESAQRTPTDFADIIGQDRAKRAAIIAAAGGHNLLIVGPPGSGKTLIANAIAGIMPPLTNAEKVDLTRIWSSAGMLETDGQAVVRRPFRVVHHTATKQAIIGGGSRDVVPGEITLAHLGILFLDEIAEFRPDVLDSLRQPMEDGCVRISRVRHKSTLPSRFSLVAAMNPCPCGYFPDCQCGEKVVERYQSRVSGPLMDRIDLKVSVDPVPVGAEPTGESTADIRVRVTQATHRQRARLAGTEYHSNADVPGPLARRLFALSPEAETAMRLAGEQRRISMRGLDRLAKVARTAADLDGIDGVEERHITEAVRFV